MSAKLTRPTMAQLRAAETEAIRLRNALIDVSAKAFVPAEGYETLFKVLREAHDQAAYGKGASRHGNALPYAVQPMQTIGFLLHSSEGMLYQVIKKTQEANSRLEAGRRSGDPETMKAAKAFARQELLGAINYLAGALIYEDAHQ